MSGLLCEQFLPLPSGDVPGGGCDRCPADPQAGIPAAGGSATAGPPPHLHPTPTAGRGRGQTSGTARTPPHPHLCWQSTHIRYPAHCSSLEELGTKRVDNAVCWVRRVCGLAEGRVCGLAEGVAGFALAPSGLLVVGGGGATPSGIAPKPFSFWGAVDPLPLCRPNFAAARDGPQ